MGTERQFVCCKILWKIENFCLAISTEDSSVECPDFILQGVDSAKWRLSLELSGETELQNGSISFCLERLMCPGPVKICMDWEVTLAAGIKEFGPYYERHAFESCSMKKQSLLVSIRDVVEHLLPFKPDTIIIQCYLIARDEEKEMKLEDPPACGLKFLSEDMKMLFESGQSYADIKIEVEGKFIEAHKAILSRNFVMEKYMKESKNGVIELMHFDYETVYKFIAFLYSGNMDYILRRPTVPMIKCIEHFHCDILKCYCAPEELNMTTRVQAEAHEFHWVIHDLLEKGEFAMSSPPIKRLNVNTTWKLTVSVKTENSDKSDDYISVVAEIIDGDKPSYFSLEFALLNDSGEKFYTKRQIRFNRSYDNLGFQRFVQIGALDRSALMDNGDARIVFRVRTSEGIKEKHMGCRMMSLVTSSGTPSYQELSAEMRKLLDSKMYNDITLTCGIQAFTGHKCVLAARSPAFQRTLEPSSFDSNCLNVADIEPDLLEHLLRYIYTGIIEKDTEVPRLLLLYLASSEMNFDVPALKNDSCRILKEKGIDINEIDIVRAIMEYNNGDFARGLKGLKPLS